MNSFDTFSFPVRLSRGALSSIVSLLLAGLFVGGVGTTQAQQVPAQNFLTADRPGLGDRAATLAGGEFQAELGYVYNSNGFRSEVGTDFNTPPSGAHEFGQVLFRYGLTEAVELRAGLGSYVLNEDPLDNGYAGTTVGAKVRLFRTNMSTLTGMATLGIPAGTGQFDAPDDRARQQVKLAFNGALGSGVALAVNAGTRFYYASGTQDDQFVEWLFIPTLQFGLTPAADAYAGYGGFYNDGPNTSWVEAGFMFLVTSDMQLDLNAGFRVDGNVPNDEEAYFLGLGFAHRF